MLNIFHGIHRGALPPLTEQEAEVSQRLRRHIDMLARVIGLSADDYRTWHANKAKELQQAQAAAAAQQKALQAQQAQNSQ